MKISFKFWIGFLTIIILFSCNNHDKDKIVKLLKSDDKTEIMEGCSLLKDKKDTLFVKYLFKNIEDRRISHNAKFYGISVHQATIGALRRISGIAPPNKISYNFDSANTDFYKKWAIEKGYYK